MENEKQKMEEVKSEIIDIFGIAAENLRKEIDKKRMRLSPLIDMRKNLMDSCLKFKDKNFSGYEYLLFHFFLMNYYINHIMNHIAGDASCKLKDARLKNIACKIAEGFENYVRDLKDEDEKAYRGLMMMPLPYLKEIKYLRGDKNGY